MSPDSDITQRPAITDDHEFLQRVYAESRAAELQATQWTEAEKSVFCRSQFAAQDSHYREHYPNCEFLIIEHQGEAVGRLYLDRRADEIRVVDIALLAAARGQGLGGVVMARIIDEAKDSQLPVRIHVERSNRARHLYDRLGFQMVEEGEVYDLLAWTPSR